MATPPTRVARFETSSGWVGTTTPQTVTLTGLQVGDLITLFVLTEHVDPPPDWAFTPSCTGVTFTVRGPQIAGAPANRSCVLSWTGEVTTAGSPTLTVTKDTGPVFAWGFEATVWRAHGGVGDFDSAYNAGPAAPAVTLTTAADSAVLCCLADWNDTAITGRVWRTINGAAGTETMAASPGAYGRYSAYWPDTDAASNVVGMTAPDQRYSIAAIEVLAVADQAVAAPWLQRPPGRRAPNARWWAARSVDAEVAASPQSFDLDVATLSLTGVDATLAGTGEAATTLDVATLTLAGQDAAVAGSGAASTTLDVAALSLAGIDAAVAGSGAASTTLDVAALVLIGQDVAVAGTGAASTTLDVATLTLAAQDVAVAGSGAATTALDVATLTLTGQDIAATGTGAASADLDPATLLLGGQDVTTTGSGTAAATFDPASLLLTGQDVTGAGTGDASTAFDPAVLTLVGQDTSLNGSGVTTWTLDVAALVLAGVDITLGTGGAPQAFDLDPAVLALTGVEVTLTGAGSATTTLDVAALTLVGIDPTATGSGTASVVADSATLTLTGTDLTTTGTGAASVAVDAATLTLTGVDVIVVSITADPSPVTTTLRESGHTATVSGERTRGTVRSRAATTVRADPNRLTIKPSTRATAKEN